jgi:hypothetical protein
MRQNKKLKSIIKSKSVISEIKEINHEIPKEDTVNLNEYLNNEI